MSVTFKRESFNDWLADAVYIIHSHWQEANDDHSIPIDIDHDTYLALERAGVLHIICGRNESNELIAYWSGLVYPHLHYKKILTSYDDVIWVRPDYRGITVLRLYKFLDNYLEDLGVGRVYHRSKPSKHRVGGILEKLGYTKTEESYMKSF